MLRTRATTVARLTRRCTSAAGSSRIAVRADSGPCGCRSGPGRFPDHQFRLHDNLFRVVCLTIGDAIEQYPCAALSHLKQRLPHGGERWGGVSGGLDVVKADDRDVARHAQARILEGANGADGSDVVKAENRGEVASLFKQRLHWLIA